MILSLIRSVFCRRISPTSYRLCAQFLRRGVPPPRLNRPASEDPPAHAVAPARSLDVEIYEIYENPCPVSVLGHGLSTGCMHSRGSFRHVLIDLRPMGRVTYPAGVAMLGVWAGG